MNNRKQLIVLLILLIIAGVVFYRQFMVEEMVIRSLAPGPPISNEIKNEDILLDQSGARKLTESVGGESARDPDIALVALSPDKKADVSKIEPLSAALSSESEEDRVSVEVIKLREIDIIKLDQSGTAHISRAKLSPSADKLLISTEDGRGLSIYLLDSRSEWEISEEPGSGYGACWSPDGRRVGFKEVDPETGQERPMIYEVETGYLAALDKEGRYCCNPVFIKDGLIGLTAGKNIYLYDEDLNVKKKLILEEKSGPAACSPDGKYSAVATGSGIVLVDLESEDKNLLAPPGTDYRDLKFSPHGRRLILETVSGELSVTDLVSGNTMNLGRGSDAQWFPDGKQVVYLRNRRLIIDGVNSSEIIIADIPSGAENTIFQSDDSILSSISLAPETRLVSCVFSGEGEVRIYSLEKPK